MSQPSFLEIWRSAEYQQISQRGVYRASFPETNQFFNCQPWSLEEGRSELKRRNKIDRETERQGNRGLMRRESKKGGQISLLSCTAFHYNCEICVKSVLRNENAVWTQCIEKRKRKNTPFVWKEWIEKRKHQKLLNGKRQRKEGGKTKLVIQPTKPMRAKIYVC